MNSAPVVRALSFCLGLVLILPCLAQQTPTPIPVPGSPPIGPSPAPGEIGGSRRKKDKEKGKAKQELPTITFEGLMLDNNGKQFVVHTADGRFMTSAIDSGTKWLHGDAPLDAARFVRGTTVKVESAEDGEENLTALTVQLVKDLTPEQKTGADAPKQQAQPQASSESDDLMLTESKKPLDVPDAPDRPKMTHQGGISSGTASIHDDNGGASQTTDLSGDEPRDQPKPVAKSEKTDSNGQQDFTIGFDAPTRSASRGGPGSAVLQRSMDWAETFDEGLPNYLCREVITRYVQQTRGGDWEPLDVVTANLVYQDGHEDYRDITVGNKKVSDFSKTGGSWSTGEFASMLHSLFQPTRQTDFKYAHAVTIHDIEAAEFDYTVALPNSDWSIVEGGQLLRPKYSGTLWIEKDTGVVRRLEQEANNIPKDFPLDEVQSAIDYEEISLGAKQFLLPVRAENIACQRSSSYCSKNVIEFRDYHKFSGESTITFK